LTFDLARARRETPGVANVLHLNNAGAALMPQPVLDALTDHLRLEAMIGGYEAHAAMHDAAEHTYDAIAELIGCHRDEIAVVENATRAWDMAFYAVPLGPGDRILTSVSEYGSNYLAFLQAARRTGAEIAVIPNDEHGQLSVEALEQMIDERTKLIAITHVPSNGGLVNPAAAVGEVARRAGVLYLLDACQSIGQMPLDVETTGCDMLSATGRKYLRGPRGTGFLYVRREVIERLEPPFVDVRAATWVERDRYVLRPDARRFENWEAYIAGKIGLGVAVDYALGWGLDAIQRRVTGLADALRERLSELPGVTVRDLGAERCGIVSFTVEGRDPGELKERLGERQVNVTISGRDATRIDMEQRGLIEMVRSSVHYYNSEDELDRFVEVLRGIIG